MICKPRFHLKSFDFSLRNPRLLTLENLLDFKRQIECALTSLLDLFDFPSYLS